MYENHIKVSFSIASEASYVYIKMAKMVHFGDFPKSKSSGQTVFPDFFIEQKFVENAKIEKDQMRHFE